VVLEEKAFAAVLQPDYDQLRSLRLGLMSWLSEAGISGRLRDDIVFATHEAAASAMGSPGDVTVDATLAEKQITVIVASEDGWQAPDEDVDGQRMRLVRDLMNDVSFERQFGRSSLRLVKALSN
jgi:hypothetical protein